MNNQMIKHIYHSIHNLKYDNDIKILHHTLFEGKRITKRETNVKVGLINVPCGGFGDIVNCKTFSNYFQSK